MARVNRDVLEKRISDIECDIGANIFEDSNYIEEYSYRNNRIGDKRLSQEELLVRSIKNLSFHISRFTSENYALSTLTKLNKYMQTLKYEFEYYGHEKLDIMKLQITYIEIILSLDITFIDSLKTLYEFISIKNNYKGDNAQLTFNDIENYYKENHRYVWR